MLVHVGWLDRVQIPSDVSSVECREYAWWVESVVVWGSQVDDSVEELVASLLDLIAKLLHLGGLVRLLLFFLTQQELVKSIGTPLNTINGVFMFVELTTSQNSAITRTAKRLGIEELLDDSDSFFELSGEELVESFKLSQIWNFHLVEIYSINLSECSINQGPNWSWKLQWTSISCQSGNVSWYSNLMFDGLVFPDDLIQRITVNSCHQQEYQSGTLPPVAILFIRCQVLSGESNGEWLSGSGSSDTQ